jgi:ubiquinone/menaquinone biosynthesis C-methylase UbiE
LDYGCGIGSYTLPAARIVGDEGEVYALDIHPLAIQGVERRADSAGLTNIQTILSGLETGLPDGHVDVVLLYDVFHAVEDQETLLRELHRVLRPGGILAVLPDHLSRAQLLGSVCGTGLFDLEDQGDKLFLFARSNGA